MLPIRISFQKDANSHFMINNIIINFYNISINKDIYKSILANKAAGLFLHKR